MTNALKGRNKVFDLMEVVFPMLDERLISKPLPEPSAWLPPIVESAIPVVDACLSAPGPLRPGASESDAVVPHARRFLNAAVVLAASQIVQKLSATQPAPDVLLKLVESLRYLYAVSDQATPSGEDANDCVLPDCLPAVIQEIYGVHSPLLATTLTGVAADPLATT